MCMVYRVRAYFVSSFAPWSLSLAECAIFPVCPVSVDLAAFAAANSGPVRFTRQSHVCRMLVSAFWGACVL